MAAGFLYFEPMRWLAESWRVNPYYRHGFYVLFFSAVLAVANVVRAKETAGRNRWWIHLFVVSIFMYGLGYYLGMNTLKAIPIFFTLLGIAYLLGDYLPARDLRFPLLFPLVSVPIPFLSELTAFLQFAIVGLSTSLLQAAGLDIYSEGVVIHLPQATFRVGEPSSGIQSLIALLTLMVLLIYFTKTSVAKKVLLCVMAVPIAVFSNLLRVVTLLIVGEIYGERTAVDFWHDAGNILFFVLSLIFLAGLWYLIVHRSKNPAARAATGSNLIFAVLAVALLNLHCSPSPPSANAEKGGPVHKFTADTSYYFSTRHEGKFVANTDFLFKPHLEQLPFELGHWVGEEIKTDDSNILYLRSYENTQSGALLYLVAVHGTNESLFHTPEVCYIGDAWKIEERKIKRLEARGESFPVRHTIARKDNFRHLILYWYIWPNSRRIITDGMAMFRLSVRIESSVEEAERAALDFVQELSALQMDLRKEAKTARPAPLLPQVVKKKSEPSEFTRQKEKAVEWLKSQIVPNDIVPKPAQDRRHLVVSYRVPKAAEAYRYVFSKASLYDNALAVISLSMVEEFSAAERIIDGASRVLSPDGDLWFMYNTHDSWPNVHDHHGAIVRSGASAWLGYAITYYLTTRLVHAPDLFDRDGQAVEYLGIARSIADRILSRQVTDRSDPRHGFITGGEGRYEYRRNGESQAIEEVFLPGTIQWASVEHNIDIYFFLRDLARLTRAKKYESAARLVRQAILNKAWNAKIGQLNRGQRLAGADPAKALDCASWGAMFLEAIDEKRKAKIALEQVSRYFVRSGNAEGFKPYVDLLLYEEREINALFFPDDPDKNWNDLPMIWPEGTLGVAMAYLKLGQVERAKRVISGIVGLQDQAGGFPYATENMRFQFSRNPSVAGTAWLIMAVSALEDETVRGLFWGK